MKNLVFTFILLLLSISAYTQNNLWINYPNQAFSSDVCPSTQIPYYYTASKNNDNLDGCTFNWTITNGIIEGSIAQPPTTYSGYGHIIGITWNNIAQKGTIKVTLSGCSDTANNTQIANATLYIKSLTGVTPSAINNKTSQVVPFGKSPEFFGLSNSVTYPSNGKDVDSYYWTIPNGWSYDGVISNGQVFTTSSQGITVIPNPVSSGKVTVKGHTECGFESNPQQLTITRPAITIQSPKSIIYQGDVAPITMSLSIPNSSSYSYEWNKPLSWQFKDGINNTPSITLIPDGCKGGQVTCTITSEGQSVSATPLTIICKPFPDDQVPTISGNNFLCANEPYSILNLPNLTSSINWSINSFARILSGQGTQTIMVSPVGNSSGNATISVAISIGGCMPIAVKPLYVWVGYPATPEITTNVNKVGVNSLVEAFAESNGANSFTWSVSGGTIVNGQGTSELLLRTSPRCLYDLTLRVKSQNACGISSQITKTIPFDCSGGPSPLIITPNPASETITVELNLSDMEASDMSTTIKSEDQELTVKLLNQSQIPVYQSKLKTNRFTINVSSYPIGIYYLQVIKGKNIYSEKVIVTK